MDEEKTYSWENEYERTWYALFVFLLKVYN